MSLERLSMKFAVVPRPWLTYPDATSDHVRTQIGPIAKPRQIMIVPELPKARSGKIMRRLLRDIAEKREVGDTTTLADSTIMDLISAGQATTTED